MIDPFDTYHQLMDARPKLLHKTPGAMCNWIGRIKQQYGTVAIELRDLQAEYEAVKTKARKWDRFITGLEAESERMSIIVEKYPCEDKLEAIKRLVESYYQHTTVWEVFSAELEKILEEEK